MPHERQMRVKDQAEISSGHKAVVSGQLSVASDWMVYEDRLQTSGRRPLITDH
jgi:hypothetical protein